MLYVIEANPRASRTVPFVSKALGIPMAKAASRIMVGATIAELKDGCCPPPTVRVFRWMRRCPSRRPVPPFKRFRTKDGKIVDSVLGPEMRSTGEVMGIDKDFPTAFAKSQAAAYGGMPTSGTVFISVADADKRAVILPAHRRQQLGFTLVATEGTAEILAQRHRGEGRPEVQRDAARGRRRERRGSHQRREDRHCREHALRGERRAQMAMKIPGGRGRGGQGPVHDDRGAGRRGRRDGCPRRGFRGQEPAGVRPRPSGRPVTQRQTTPRFGERIRAALAARGPLCVGIDPHAALLTSWGLPDSAAGVREFGLRTVDAAASRVGVVKPQVSFFERFGSAGFTALEDVLQAARDAGLLAIADAKRGDIGTTMDAYASAWLTPGSPLEADALTVNPFLGVGTLDSTFARAEAAARASSCSPRRATPRHPMCSRLKPARLRPFPLRSLPR